MAFGVKRDEMELWKEKASRGEIAIITHYWLDDRFPDSKTVTKVACSDLKKLQLWGKQYGLAPDWIDNRRKNIPHYDLFGEMQLVVLKREHEWEQIERFHLEEKEND
ncbi:hypothetical protein HCJ52_07040 [Listeria sp. FSL L7-1485]|uniref:YneQ n=1 Tax=Listeria immobilis TaxID=2713502 RepID=A0A7X0X769_9LIST|nr:hypothetical protein [Listeria immobilis]MBC1484073.1 hypothetical protein [Listeria immobilis]MBC1488593.1 hypothetical protein [Listeria immobilis]MBC1506178.1 hypothetical protein [Listeria immobilis]MBC1509962.1 hypothetical protein [Listeria immobilis]MBC1515269.1 hypothetical protein [Listeria immobilis]